MTAVFVVLSVYCGLILLASLAGGWVPMIVRLTHKRMEVAVSFVAGVMLGIGVLHMLPHAVMARAEMHADETTMHEGIHEAMGPVLLWLIAGFLAMFFIARFFRFHVHEAPANDTADHEHHHQCDHHHAPQHGMSWAGAAMGLSLHSLIEGIALASSVEILYHGEHAGLVGLGTFLVIFLHKPFDAMTIGTLMSVGGRSRFSRHLVNAAFSLLIPVGVLLFHFGVMNVEDRALITSAALAFSAGTFLCISLSDLLPELQFHQHDRVKLSAALLAGLALAWGISALESRLLHAHDHVPAAAVGVDQPHSQPATDAYLYTVMLGDNPTFPAAS